LSIASPLLSSEKRKELLCMLKSAPLDFSSLECQTITINYGDDPKQKMHLMLPTHCEGPFPVLFFLHGGGWAGGSPDDCQVKPFLPGLSRGFAVVSCGYRLLPSVLFPDILFDVKQALSCLEKRKNEFRLDTQRLSIAGCSAGAHLGLLTAFTQGQPAYSLSAEAFPTIRSVVDLYGPTDFSSEDEHFNKTGIPRLFPIAPPEQSAPSRLLGFDVSSNPGLMRLISPLHLVHEKIPPVLLLHGRFDPMVSYLQSQTLFEKIEEVCGVGHAEFILSDDTTHADYKYESEPFTSIIFDFLNKTLN